MIELASSCFVCGNTSDLLHHHTQYKPARLITVCKQCHFEIHRNGEFQTYLGKNQTLRRLSYGQPFSLKIFGNKDPSRMNGNWIGIVTNPMKKSLGGGTGIYLWIEDDDTIKRFVAVGWPILYRPNCPQDMFDWDPWYILAFATRTDSKASKHLIKPIAIEDLMKSLKDLNAEEVKAC